MLRITVNRNRIPESGAWYGKHTSKKKSLSEASQSAAFRFFHCNTLNVCVTNSLARIVKWSSLNRLETAVFGLQSECDTNRPSWSTTIWPCVSIL